MRKILSSVLLVVTLAASLAGLMVDSPQVLASLPISPVVWWLIACAVLMVVGLLVIWLPGSNWISPKVTIQPGVGQDRYKLKPAATEVELVSKVVRGKSFHIYDLVRDDTKNHTLRGYTLEDCDIIGPAVIWPDYDNNFESPSFTTGGDQAHPNNVIWVRDGLPPYGALILQHCTFRRCRFLSMGIGGDTGMAADMLNNTADPAT